MIIPKPYKVKLLNKKLDIWTVIGPGIPLDKDWHKVAWHCGKDVAQDHADELNMAVAYGLSNPIN
jgi:hypothetical protein